MKYIITPPHSSFASIRAFRLLSNILLVYITKDWQENLNVLATWKAKPQKHYKKYIACPMHADRSEAVAIDGRRLTKEIKLNMSNDGQHVR